MAIVGNKIWPDQEFPKEAFGYAADRSSAHDFSTPFYGREEVVRDIERLKTDKNTYRLRIARYELVEVTEIECVGKRPLENQQAT